MINRIVITTLKYGYYDMNNSRNGCKILPPIVLATMTPPPPPGLVVLVIWLNDNTTYQQNKKKIRKEKKNKWPNPYSGDIDISPKGRELELPPLIYLQLTGWR